MIIQHVIKGVSGIDQTRAQQLLDGGIKCNWWLNQNPLPFHEIPVRLTERNLQWHQNHYGEIDPEYPDPSNPSNEPFYLHTPFISTTAGTVVRDGWEETNALMPAWEVALKFATNKWTTDGWLFYCYLFVLGRPAVAQLPFAEELRDLNISTSYSAFQPEGEITAKIVIPPAQIERAEFWDLQDVNDAVKNRKLPKAAHTLHGKHYVQPDTFNNVRGLLE
jgi:hypothetical protein